MHVNLTYFKPSGKYYTMGEFQVAEGLALHEIFELVQELRKEGNAPGLCPGFGNHFYVLVEVPEHPHDHPKLLLPLAPSEPSP